MRYLLKKSLILDIIYASCFLAIFLTVLFLADKNGIYIFKIDADEFVALVAILFISGYIGLLIGAINLVSAIKKIKDIDGYESNIDLSDKYAERRFVKNHTLPVLITFIYFALSIGILANSNAKVNMAIVIVLIVVSFILSIMIKITRRQFISVKKTSATETPEVKTAEVDTPSEEVSDNNAE